MKNSKGKTSTIIIILITLLLISCTAIGFYLYQKENQMRKDLEVQLQDSKTQQDKLSNDLRDAKKQLLLLQDKNKEADAKINNLMDEIELTQGLRNELKKENGSLKEAIEAAKKEKEALKAELNDTAKKLQENLEILKAEQVKTKDLQAQIYSYDQSETRRQSRSDIARSRELSPDMPPPAQQKMELDKIVVGEQSDKGRVLSVDKESDFVICNLGSLHGIQAGDVLSVYHEDQYLGELKVSRVQEEMSAADFVPPLSSRKVRKNDIVVLKQS